MSPDLLALIDTITVILILLAVIAEIFFSWRWHKESIKEMRHNKNRR